MERIEDYSADGFYTFVFNTYPIFITLLKYEDIGWLFTLSVILQTDCAIFLLQLK